MKIKIASLPGDGIGPDVIAEGLKVLRAVEAKFPGTSFEIIECPAGAGEYKQNGDPLPAATLEKAQSCDAILLGAMGLPDVRWPDNTEMVPQIDIREKLDLYCGLRPIKLLHANDTPLKRYEAGQIDFVIIRENTEGLFFSRRAAVDPAATEVRDTMRISRSSAERICHSAFVQARKRKGLVTLVDKANVLPSMAFFRRIFDEIAAEYADIRTERVYVDAASLFLIQRPETFDVLVTENMFGDILSDLAAGLIGGMGMAPSADIGDKYAVFQPSHGTAPDIAGRGIANPVATILSVALMLEWLATPDTLKGAATVRKAVEQVFADPTCRTRDMGGKMTTSEMGEAIVNAF